VVESGGLENSIGLKHNNFRVSAVTVEIVSTSGERGSVVIDARKS